MEKVIFKTVCGSKANHHIGKYTHWSRIIESIDVSKDNGYAFIGEGIKKYNSENLVDNGAFIVECCGNNFRLVKAVGDNEIEELATGSRGEFVTFIRNCNEIINTADKQIDEDEILAKVTVEDILIWRDNLKERDRVYVDSKYSLEDLCEIFRRNFYVDTSQVSEFFEYILKM